MSSMQRGFLYSFILVVGVVATIVSFRFVRPEDCQQPGSCQIGEQRAGFPLPMINDVEGESLTDSWGKLGPEDYIYFNPFTIIGNFIFWIGIAWLVLRPAVAIATQGLYRLGWRQAAVLSYVIPILLLGLEHYSHFPLPPPPIVPPIEEHILGTWSRTNIESGETIFVRFYDGTVEGGRWRTWSQSSEELGGEGIYVWHFPGMLIMQLEQNEPRAKGDCTDLPSLFAEVCADPGFPATLTPIIPEQSSTPLPLQSTPLATETPVQAMLSVDIIASTQIESESLVFDVYPGASYRFSRVSNE